MKLSDKRKKDLSTAAVEALASERGITVEEAVFTRMKTSPSLFGALSDWDDVRTITIDAIRELRPFLPYADIYAILLRVIDLYDTQVISVLRVFSDVRRLAYFVNEIVEQLNDVVPYREAVVSFYGLDPSNRLAVRGAILKRITSPELRTLLLNDRGRYFKAECCCAPDIGFPVEPIVAAASEEKAA